MKVRVESDWQNWFASLISLSFGPVEEGGELAADGRWCFLVDCSSHVFFILVSRASINLWLSRQKQQTLQEETNFHKSTYFSRCFLPRILVIAIIKMGRNISRKQGNCRRRESSKNVRFFMLQQSGTSATKTSTSKNWKIRLLLIEIWFEFQYSLDVA